jgi:hypothetical protein
MSRLTQLTRLEWDVDITHSYDFENRHINISPNSLDMSVVRESVFQERLPHIMCLEFPHQQRFYEKTPLVLK